jgi:hypothetical protein
MSGGALGYRLAANGASAKTCEFDATEELPANGLLRIENTRVLYNCQIIGSADAASYLVLATGTYDARWAVMIVPATGDGRGGFWEACEWFESPRLCRGQTSTPFPGGAGGYEIDGTPKP